MKAYVLIKTQGGSAAVSEALRPMSGIDSVEEVTGAFDAIAIATGESLSELLQRVVARIRELPGVLHVLPAPLVGSSSSALPVATHRVEAA